MELTTTGRGQLFGDRFRTVRLLKQSHGIDTWLAQDLTRPGRVVLKALSAASVPTSVQHRLEHEAGVLRELDRNPPRELRRPPFPLRVRH